MRQPHSAAYASATFLSPDSPLAWAPTRPVVATLTAAGSGTEHWYDLRSFVQTVV